MVNSITKAKYYVASEATMEGNGSNSLFMNLVWFLGECANGTLFSIVVL